MPTEEMTGRTTPSAALPAVSGPELGTTIGRFIVVGMLGAGGMGVVVQAFDPWLDRKVAIKLLRPRLDGDEKVGQRTARLLREAQAMARIAHRNVIAVHDVGTLDEQVFIAMEHVNGETLATWLQRPRGWREIVPMFAQAARGLAAAHASGLVHRDFKPDNVLVARDGRVLVTDFGVVGVAGVEEGEEPPADLPHGDLTGEGIIVGTPAYMAPEQRGGGAVNGRADQYSLCVALERALAGKPAPRRLRRLVQRGLARDPAARFPSMAALAGGLERHPVGPARLALAGALVVGLAVLALRPDRAPEPCSGFADRLAGKWDAPARAAIRAAFLATGRPGAEDHFARVAGTFDGYAGDWLAMRRDACLATAVRREQSPALLNLRIACLDRRLSALGALAGVLARADGEAVARAAPAALALDPIADCADAAALTAAIPPPRDPDARAWAAAIDGRLDRAQALDAAGKPRPAFAVAALAAVEADVHGHLPLRARARMLHASLRRLVGGTDLDAVVEEAARVAAAARDDADVARALALLVTWRAERGRIDEALALRPALLAAAERSGRDGDRALARRALGSAYAAAQDYVGAEVELRAALALFERDVPDGVEVIGALGRLASVLANRRQLDEAEALLRRGLAIGERRLGPDSLEAAGLYNQLSQVADRREDWPAALQDLERMRAIVVAAYGEDSRPALTGRLNTALVLLHAGRNAEALAAYVALEPRCREVFGAESPAYLRLALHQASALMELDRATEARPLIDRAAEVLERRSPDTPDLASALMLRADLMRGLDRKPAEALPVYQRAVAILERKEVRGHPETLDALAGLAECHLDLGHPAEALPILRRALADELESGRRAAVHARLTRDQARATTDR